MTTAYVVFSTEGIVRTGSTMTVGAHLDDLSEVRCSALQRLQEDAHDSHTPLELEVYASGTGFRMRTEVLACSSATVRNVSMRFARLLRKHLGARTTVSELRSIAAVERVLA